MSEPFHILSVDGGGFRGLFAAHLLKKMEEVWQIDWGRRFGLMAGTSTGSILTAGLAAGVSAANLTEFYKTHGKAIFSSPWQKPGFCRAVNGESDRPAGQRQPGK